MPSTPLAPVPLGLDPQIERLIRECHSLADRADMAARAGNLLQESTLHRMLDAKREVLRRWSKDDPGIRKGAGNAVPKEVVVQYATEICTLIQTLPNRIATLMPAGLDDEVRMRIDSEIRALMELAREVKIRTE